MAAQHVFFYGLGRLLVTAKGSLGLIEMRVDWCEEVTVNSYTVVLQSITLPLQASRLL
jgi:hypothetical protein